MKPCEQVTADGLDADAMFSAMFAEEFDYVFHSLRRLGVQPGELDDVTHDVFVAVYRHIEDYERARPVRPWLFGFCFRVARDHRALARHRREVHASEGDDLPDSTPGADVAVERRRARALVLSALAELDPGKRAVIVMHDLDGHGMPEIAEALELPLNTAYSRLRLARAQFREVIERLRTRGGP